MTDLARTQQLVWQLITAPAGVEDGIRRLRQQRALEGDDLSFLVAPGRKLDPTEQLGIYADMYFYRLRDCLAEDFPRLASHLGEVGFHNLVTDYLWAHPSEHPSLRELGRRLPGFLARHELAATHPGAADLAG